MGFFRKSPGTGPPVARDVEALALPLAEPALRVVAVGTAPAGSFFLGDPLLPSGVAWPEKSARKLAFLARLELPEVHAALPVSWLPQSGALCFFYDMEERPDGYQPEHGGSWAVVYVAADIPQARPTPPSQGMTFERVQAPPTFHSPGVRALDLDFDERQRLISLQCRGNRGSTQPYHQIAGFPLPVQGDGMEAQCQFVSNGRSCGDVQPEAHFFWGRKKLLAGAEDWRLLFQVDSDEKLGFCWEDCGSLYFWIREQDARAMRFDRAWVIVQSH